ncbi:hypothetical protein EG68_02660 [Paragonimus skrjabini miyazakii]|uniref:Uncharacterized protein n=1 Tax=Paragonimus skrjabini miyazakii TaxID=59628 RepID=A0A8S9YXZ4_9TREM|nr:hypothetical protein EG68_02660 [Paragonimus skrjabini miyazakii]
MFGLTPMLIVLLAAGMVKMLPEEQYQAIMVKDFVKIYVFDLQKSLDKFLSKFRSYVCQKETDSKLTTAAKAIDDIGQTGVI